MRSMVAWGPTFTAGPPQDESGPLGGQRIMRSRVAWGPTFIAGPPQDERRPPRRGAADHAQQGSVGAYFNQPRRLKYHMGSSALAIMTPMAQA
ncbi:hypothetical protein ABIE13_002083 [Ottowia thiooxydans]|uniref:Uncharacterized protein n=1 Tax=Ottowia thiooxydans TaxID=219182 RepID=A0ABV2Q8S6_9BURK